MRRNSAHRGRLVSRHRHVDVLKTLRQLTEDDPCSAGNVSQMTTQPGHECTKITVIGFARQHAQAALVLKVCQPARCNCRCLEAERKHAIQRTNFTDGGCCWHLRRPRLCVEQITHNRSELFALKALRIV